MKDETSRISVRTMSRVTLRFNWHIFRQTIIQNCKYLKVSYIFLQLAKD